MCQYYKSLEDTMGKGEIAIPTVSSTLLENFPPFLSNLKMSSANSFSLEESKICRLGKGFMQVLLGLLYQKSGL